MQRRSVDSTLDFEEREARWDSKEGRKGISMLYLRRRWKVQRN